MTLTDNVLLGVLLLRSVLGDCNYKPEKILVLSMIFFLMLNLQNICTIGDFYCIICSQFAVTVKPV